MSTPGERAAKEFGLGGSWDAIAHAARTEPDDNEPATVEWLLENHWVKTKDYQGFVEVVWPSENTGIQVAFIGLNNPIADLGVYGLNDVYASILENPTRRQVRLLMEALA